MIHTWKEFASEVFADMQNQGIVSESYAQDPRLTSWLAECRADEIRARELLTRLHGTSDYATH